MVDKCKCFKNRVVGVCCWLVIVDVNREGRLINEGLEMTEKVCESNELERCEGFWASWYENDRAKLFCNVVRRARRLVPSVIQLIYERNVLRDCGEVLVL